MLKFGTYTNSNIQNSMVMFIFFCFSSEIAFLGIFVFQVYTKDQNCQLKVKLDTQTNSNMLISVMLFNFFFRTETPFLGRFGPNYQYLLFKEKLDTLTNSIMQNSMAVFTFFFFNQKHFFGASLVKNVKIVSLRLNLVAGTGILKSHTHQQEYHQPSVDGTC